MPTSHYGAHKAAVEQFVRGQGYPICALRPTSFYGLTEPASKSKWFDLVRAVVRGEDIVCHRGGKAVHAADVAKAARFLISAPGIAGEVFNCYDRYVSEYEVATLTNLEELERALAYPWEKWTVFLHHEQRQWVDRDYNGPARVKTASQIIRHSRLGDG